MAELAKEHRAIGVELFETEREEFKRSARYILSSYPKIKKKERIELLKKLQKGTYRKRISGTLGSEFRQANHGSEIKIHSVPAGLAKKIHNLAEEIKARNLLRGYAEYGNKNGNKRMHLKLLEGAGIDFEAREKHVVLSYRTPEAQSARVRLILGNQPLVFKRAGFKAQYFGVSVEELVQEGNFGLMRALDEYSFKRGYEFSTYAVHSIDRKCNEYAQRRNMIRISKLMSQRAHELQNEAEKKEISLSQLGRRKRMRSYQIAGLIRARDARGVGSLQDIVPAVHGEIEMVETLEDKKLIMPEVCASRHMEGIKPYIRGLVRRLPHREGIIIKMRYLESKKLEEISKVLNVSRERVRQIEVQALERLRRYAGKENKFYD